MSNASQVPNSETEETNVRKLPPDANVVEIAAAQPAGTAAIPQPTLKHALWFVVVGANAAFLIFLIPTEILGSEKLGLLLKIISWLGGSVLVLGYKLLRDRILKLTESVVFKATQTMLLSILAVLVFSQLEAFNLHVMIEPGDAEVKIDDGKPQATANGWIKVSLRPHTFTVTDKRPAENGTPIQREFAFGLGEVLHAWRNPEPGLHLPLIYDVPIYVRNRIDELEIRKNGSGFDAQFWTTSLKSHLGKEVRTDREHGLLFVSWQGHGDSLRLPYGSYYFVARQNGCADSEAQPDVQVHHDLVTVEFTKVLNCPK